MVTLDLSRTPFALLDEAGQQRVMAQLQAADFKPGDILLDAGQVPDSLFLVAQGEVAELDISGHAGAECIGHYLAGDCFGGISLLHGQSRYRFRADQVTRCYLLPRVEFLALCDDFPLLAERFRRRLADKSRLLAAQRAAGGALVAGAMLSRARECMRQPERLPSGATIVDAVRALDERRVDSLLVEVGDATGMVTKTDLLNALVLRQYPADTPLERIANVALISMRPDQYLFEALVTMTRHRIERVVIMEEAIPLGVVELTDALSHFSSQSHVVSLQIERAEDQAALAQASRRLPNLVRGLAAQGAKPRFIMALLAALNGRLMARTWHFLIDAAYQGSCCLMVMGSEGRGEQVLKTDQDNGLILGDDLDWPDCASQMQAFSDALLELGYPPCPGGIMVSNPQWVGTVSQWCQRIEGWARHGDADALMNLAILLDAHAMAGNPVLLSRLRETLFDCCSTNEILLSHFARPVLRFGTPLTLFGSLKKPKDGIDIKKAGIFPIVHGVRVMALERHIGLTSTLERLEALVADGRLEARFADDLGEALSLFTEWRLKQQLAHLDGQADDPDRVLVQSLSSLEQDLLREALHIVKEFKQRLSHRYHLEYG
ncbi:DUF294 nucleotidyltransferase-like domain-containing protein [Halomonas sp. 18H]|uniref:DUF294 nucleotidyltransferase-like domain-containing protein n=1 Tax=Halomonas almeriensis TaxID=308163 RepID=UPI00222E553C|nr:MULTISPECIES: DUF294 nucleotidyltransferase-like domain-containing protein [Halomonas]MCW4149523.1 DUF294 nucleotidyltransferase-like domain-containing protein [Halomonas sp. 18H]MDN3553531.1 putative nucleotidyltransferase substrate binding domain-containing protein [Halomonas almeriensis]